MRKKDLRTNQQDVQIAEKLRNLHRKALMAADTTEDDKMVKFTLVQT
jgi:hypothetical protein